MNAVVNEMAIGQTFVAAKLKSLKIVLAHFISTGFHYTYILHPSYNFLKCIL